MLIENTLSLTEEQQSFLSVVCSSNFPWFFQESSEGFSTFSHTLMNRNKEVVQKPGDINSEYYSISESIFLKFCRENNIHVNGILRAAFNNTYHYPVLHDNIHVDHTGFEHNNFIFYVNTFNNGYTYLFDYENKLTKQITPVKHKGVVFNGVPHAQGFCDPFQNRIVMVFTFY
jgi:hypothetical protein